MSPVYFYIQYKNQSLALLNALKVKVSASFSQKGDSWSSAVPRQTLLFSSIEHFTFPAVYPAGNQRVIYWDCQDFPVRINPFLLLFFCKLELLFPFLCYLNDTSYRKDSTTLSLEREKQCISRIPCSKYQPLQLSVTEEAHRVLLTAASACVKNST